MECRRGHLENRRVVHYILSVGMASTSCDQVIALEHFIDPGSVYSLVGPTARLRPKQPGDVAQIVESLRCRDSHLLAYAKERLPKRYHYSDHRRIEPVVLDMDSGYLVLNREADKNPALCNGGSHGYDNMAPGMQSLFVAHGPAFRQNVTARPFRSIELYELMTELLGIEPEPNNGTRGALHYLLRTPKPLPEEASLRTPDMCVVDGSELGEGDKEDGCMCRNGGEGRKASPTGASRPHAAARPLVLAASSASRTAQSWSSGHALSNAASHWSGVVTLNSGNVGTACGHESDSSVYATRSQPRERCKVRVFFQTSCMKSVHLYGPPYAQSWPRPAPSSLRCGCTRTPCPSTTTTRLACDASCCGLCSSGRHATARCTWSPGRPSTWTETDAGRRCTRSGFDTFLYFTYTSCISSDGSLIHAPRSAEFSAASRINVLLQPSNEVFQ
ncbi:hypothetical protein HPB51_026028 [Rhipicephalus microplus]|uniref:Uncharacterized protein n=1 Tax=Rhipicephalus microplus TaxID=6941 RepID=A0A9J6EE47_RHIMP|nr:hypothetical protein HPB51_026028 [Rhipicephalus microplus]